jgi:hypothetical protein
VRIPGIKNVLVHVTPEGAIGSAAQPGGVPWRRSIGSQEQDKETSQ